MTILNRLLLGEKMGMLLLFATAKVLSCISAACFHTPEQAGTVITGQMS